MEPVIMLRMWLYLFVYAIDAILGDRVRQGLVPMCT
jgi:hypothetical protein